MATHEYFCDLAAAYSNNTGDQDGDGTGNIYEGPGGLLAAICGYGAATKLAPGDTLWCKGTGNMHRLVWLGVLGKDVAAAGWCVGNAVQDNNGGAEWTGEIIHVVTTSCVVELALAYDLSDVTPASGVNNTSQVDTTTTTGVSQYPIYVDIASALDGDTTDGHIKIIGVNDSWVNDGTQAVLDGNGDAVDCLVVSDVDRWWWENFTFQNATSHNVARAAGNNLYWVFKNCKSTGAGGNGFYNYFFNSLFDNCVISLNTGNGFEYTVTTTFRNCNISGNGGWGYNTVAGGLHINCVFSDNDLGHINNASSALLVTGCVLDGSSAGDAINISTNDAEVRIWGNRITNNVGFGIDQGTANDQSVIEDWNVIFNNTAGARDDVAVGPNSDDAPADDGYVKRTILITYDGGTTMNAFSPGDTITKTGGGWTGKVRTVPTGAASGTFEADTLSGGNPVNDHAFTGTAGNAVVNGAPSVVTTGDNATDYNIKTGAEIRSTALVLNW